MLNRSIVVVIIMMNMLFAGVGIMQGNIVNSIVPLDAEKMVIKGDLKKGESYAGSYLWLFTVGDSSIKAAAKNGNIKQIVYIDKKQASITFFGLLGVYKFKTIVYGY